MATYIRKPGQNGKAVWQARVRRHGHPQQTRTFDRKAEAQTWASEVEASMRAGRFLDQRPSLHITLSELLRRYLSEITPKKRGKAAETSHGRSILADPVSALSLQSCTTQKMSEFRDRRLNSVRPATVNRELNLFSHVFTVASADWSMPLPYGNPVASLRRPPVGQEGKRDRRLQGDEESRLLACAAAHEGMPIARIITFTLETVMQRGEITAMQWGHLDRQARVLLIPETKTGTPRWIPLSSRALASLPVLPSPPPRSLIWGQLHASSLSHTFLKVCRRAEIEDLRFHDLRHEAVSRLFERGLNPLEVTTISGHKSMQMLKRYTHLRAEDLVKKLG